MMSDRPSNNRSGLDIEAPKTGATPSAAVAEAPTIAPATPPEPPILGGAATSVHEEATVPPRVDATIDLTPLPNDVLTADAIGRETQTGRGTTQLDHGRYFGDYEIIREIARGGMGVVFRARQVSLNRPVALKMILAGQLADLDAVRRFHIEAEAAANLDHPGIVPIYEVGEHEGQHYFSMGFVEGQSLSQRLAGGPLPAREAAELIRRVSEAIEYAHQHGVIHRDLKPANILLDQNGNPRVTDFGLAKKVQGDSGLTGSGQIMGTPSYMPPEQAGGTRGEVGPAADVYALGATLYALVTGRPPFQAATAMDTVIQVLSDEPVPPRRLNASIPRDLETICLKCLEKEPGKRYTHAADLREDLSRYLAGDPIAARPVTSLERAVKWARRRPAIAALLGLVALGLVGLAVFVMVLAGKNRQLDDKNLELAGKNRELDSRNLELAGKNSELDQRNLELDRQRQRAERRETLAIDAVRKFRDAVEANPDLKNRLELGPLRGTLLKEPLAFFGKLRDDLQAERDTRPDAVASLADANYDLARTTEEIGSFPDAIRSYSESIDLHERLGRDRPADTECQNHLARSHNHLGILLRATGRPAQALESYGRAAAIFEQLARPQPDAVQFQDDLAGCYLNTGNLLRAMGQPAQAMGSYQKGLAVFERLAHAYPANTQVQDDLSASYMNMGNVLSDLGRRADALASLRRALPIRERLARDNPAAHQFQSGLAACLDNIGGLLFAMGRRTEAMTAHQRALEIFERLARDHPTVTRFQDDLAICFMNLGKLFHFTGQPGEALQSFSRSREIYEQLVRDHPTLANYHSSLGGALNNLAMLEMGQGRYPEVRRLLDRAVAQQRAALAALPRHPVYRQFLRNHLSLLAAAHRALNQPVEAAQAAREWAELARGNPADLYNAACSLALNVPLAQAEQSQARAAEAVQILNQAVAAGWKDAARTSRDPDLAVLHDRSDFRRLLGEIFDRSFPANPFAP